MIEQTLNYRSVAIEGESMGKHGPKPPSAHPLAPLTVEELGRLRRILKRAGLRKPSMRYAYVALREPKKRDVLAWRPGDRLPREAGLVVTDLATNELLDVVVDLDRERVVKRRRLRPERDGFAGVLDEDFPAADEIVKADPEWVAAVRRRGIADLDQVVTAALSPGSFEAEDRSGIRTIRVLAFHQAYPTDSCWAHPIGGLVAHVDLTNRRVIRVIETEQAFVPEESGDYLDPAVRGPLRTTLKPIEITQPEGVSFALEDGVLRWENWSVRLGFNSREGLTLHQLSFDDHGETRPILYRGSVSEMVVSYGDTSPTNAWQNYYDVGEYQFGRLSNSLELGCDCLGEITYVDAVCANDDLTPRVIRNAVCIHEEDYGILWKHHDMFAGTDETRRQRRLVISFFVTVGNYDYGFYWYLYLDGKIELEAKATGVVFTNAHPGGDYPYATELAPGLGAPIHQHLFSARLDMTVDGVRNAVDELEVVRVEQDRRTNPWGNAFAQRARRLRTEREGVRDAKTERQRVWRILSTERTNRLGKPTSYVLRSEGGPALLVADDAPVRRRAAFAAHHLWVTRYRRDELWAAGRTVNQHPGGAGLPEYIERDRSIDGEDIVLWHTFGLTHFPRTEDWPIMPVDYARLQLLPNGFFDRNPTLDVPNLADHCAPGTGHAGHDHAAHGHGAHDHAAHEHPGHEHPMHEHRA